MSAACSPVVSVTLADANRLLLERRAELKAARKREAALAAPPIEAYPQPGREPLTFEGVVGTQLHLGWYSKNVTTAMHRAKARREREARAEDARRLTWLTKLSSPTPNESHERERLEATLPGEASIRLYPDIALGMLRQNLEAAGRIWLLLRHIDRDGRGWVGVDEARRQLARNDAPLRVCGWRQLRNLLRQGQGVFWEQDNERIWLRSTARVAAALGVERLAGRPVTLPVIALCAGIGEVRAHFYASFHSGRLSLEGKAQATAPVARVTLEEVTGVPPRTQREYEKRVGVVADENYAVGEPATQAALQECAWKHGRAVFTLTDKKGVHGRKNKKYVARQLPNTYTGPHEQRPRGRQRHLNRQLADLRDKRDAGNGQGEDRGDQRRGYREELQQAQHRTVVRRYYENGGAAATAFNRDPRAERYWKGRRTTNGKKLWYEIAGQAE
jgi:hypothetical protein